MILWQSIALAGGLSMIGAMLVWGLAPLADNLPAGLVHLAHVVLADEDASALGVVHVFALSAAFLLGAHLVFTLLLTYARIRRQRRRHRELLNLLSSPAQHDGAVVIQHPAPVAYCLPGGARSVTVLSDGLLGLLNSRELNAVLIHERTHLAQRHHLLLWAFAAWRAALPWLPTSRLAQQSVNVLIEMLADDEVLKSVDSATLVRAIAVVATGAAPNGDGPRFTDTMDTGAAADAGITALRVRRLLHPADDRSVPPALMVCGAALLLAVPTFLLVAPGLVQ